MKKIPTGAWVVVADGTGARLLRNVGNEQPFSGSIALPHANIRTLLLRGSFHLVRSVAVAEVGRIRTVSGAG